MQSYNPEMAAIQGWLEPHIPILQMLCTKAGGFLFIASCRTGSTIREALWNTLGQKVLNNAITQDISRVLFPFGHIYT